MRSKGHSVAVFENWFLVRCADEEQFYTVSAHNLQTLAKSSIKHSPWQRARAFPSNEYCKRRLVVSLSNVERKEL